MAGDGDRRRTRRWPTAWSLLLGAPSAAGLSCSSWTKERAALRILGRAALYAPRFPVMSAAGRVREHNPRRVLQPRRLVSFGRLKLKVPAAETQRADGAMGVWAGGYSSDRLGGAGLQVPKRNESGQRPLSSPLPPQEPLQ